jgi:hypothetical protein
MRLLRRYIQPLHVLLPILHAAPTRSAHLRQTSLQPLAACQRLQTSAALPERSGTPSHDSTCVSVWLHSPHPSCAGEPAPPLWETRR